MHKELKRIAAGFVALSLCFLLFGCRFDRNLLGMDRLDGVLGGATSDSLISGDLSGTPYTYYYSTASSAIVSAPDPASNAGLSQPSAQSTAAPSATVSPGATAPVITQAPQTAAPVTQAANVASFTPAQVVDLLSRAVNQTKNYTQPMTVHHKESFDNPVITNVQPGGAVMQPAIDFVVNLVVKPTEENYQFSGGRATTSEGEQTQLLLPKAAPFSLTGDGVISASAAQENGLTHVLVTLKPEQCTSLSQVPVYNASSIGYLDIASKFSVLKIQEVNIQYPGSTIDAYIRPDGYVQSVTYTIRLSAHAVASAMGITGSADFSGNQVEVWELKW